MKAEVEATIREWLAGLLRVLGEPVELELHDEGRGSVLINLKGVSLLAGEDQETLRALSYLLELVVKRRTGESLRINLDIDGYRDRRRAQLRRMALELAEEALREGKRVRLPPMEAWERKAIHEALNGYGGVRTYSEGQGKDRRVIIEPTPTSALSGEREREQKQEQEQERR